MVQQLRENAGQDQESTLGPNHTRSSLKVGVPTVDTFTDTCTLLFNYSTAVNKVRCAFAFLVIPKGPSKWSTLR